MKSIGYLAVLMLIMWYLVTAQKNHVIPSASDLEHIAGIVLSKSKHSGKGSSYHGRLRLTVDQAGTKATLVIHDGELFSRFENGQSLEGKFYRRVLRNNLWDLLSQGAMYGNEIRNELWAVKIVGVVDLPYNDILEVRAPQMQKGRWIEALILIAAAFWCGFGIWRSKQEAA